MGNHTWKSYYWRIQPVNIFGDRDKENLAIRGGILKYKCMSGIDRWLLVVPEILKGTVLEICHSKGMAGHMGIKKTKYRILEKAIWYYLRNSCEEHVKGCAVCNRQSKGCRVDRREQQLFHAVYALERVHIYIMGSLMETQKENKIHIGYSRSIQKVGGSLSIKKTIGCGRGGSEVICGTVWVSIGDSYSQGIHFESEHFKKICVNC